MSNANLETVAAIYAAFGRGDVPFILSKLADDVEWDHRPNHGIPLLAARTGRDDVVGFFEELGNFDIQRFEVPHLVANETRVVAFIRIEGVWKPTGRRYADDLEIHVWDFDAAGQVARFNHVVDTHAMWLAAVSG